MAFSATSSSNSNNTIKKMKKDKKRPKNVKEGLTDYAEASTMHGMYYVFERGARVPSKIFW